MSDKRPVGGQRTKKRAFLHAYMINYQRQHGVAPSLQTIANHFNCSKTPIYNMLLSMAESGIVRHDYGTEPSFTAIATPAVNSGSLWKYMPLDEAGGQK